MQGNAAVPAAVAGASRPGVALTLTSSAMRSEAKPIPPAPTPHASHTTTPPTSQTTPPQSTTNPNTTPVAAARNSSLHPGKERDTNAQHHAEPVPTTKPSSAAQNAPPSPPSAVPRSA